MNRPFKNTKMSEILKKLFFMKTCKNNIIGKYGPQLVLKNWNIVNMIAKKTYFNYFCGGEKLNDIKLNKTIRNYTDEKRIKVILDYCAEKKDNENIKEIMKSIEYSNEQNIKHEKRKKRIDTFRTNRYINEKYNECLRTDSKIDYVVIKLTSLIEKKTLEKLSKIILNSKKNKKNIKYIPKNIKLKNYKTNWTENDENMDEKIILNKDECIKLKKDLENINKICKTLKNKEKRDKFLNKKKIKLLIDAEESTIQPAIDYIAMNFSEKFNDNNEPYIYNTYQLYLIDSNLRLQKDKEYLESKNKSFGCKIVRGAYMKTEEEISKIYNKKNIIFDSIDETHNNFNSIIEYSIEEINKNNNYYIIIATHNEESIEYTCKLMKNKKIKKEDMRIEFAQLHNIADHISNYLANERYNVNKYLPYGDIKKVLPYLSRRMIENNSIMNNSNNELKLAKEEIKHRLKN